MIAYLAGDPTTVKQVQRIGKVIIGTISGQSLTHVITTTPVSHRSCVVLSV
jgi:hypothetical protein